MNVCWSNSGRYLESTSEEVGCIVRLRKYRLNQQTQIFDKLFKIRWIASLLTFFLDGKGYLRAILQTKIEESALNGVADFSKLNWIPLGESVFQVEHMRSQGRYEARHQQIDLIHG